MTQTKKTRIGDIDVAYYQQGEGEPVVLVHGLAQDHQMWKAVQAAMVDFMTYAYDFRGFGETTLGEGTGTLDQLSDDLIGFLENVSGPAYTCGFSLGGTIVLHAAIKRPELFKGISVLGTSSVVGRSAKGFFSDRIELMRNGDDQAVRDAMEDDTSRQLTGHAIDLQEQVDYRVAAIGDRQGYINAAAAMSRLDKDDLHNRLSRIDADVLVIAGENDNFCPRKASEILMSGLQSPRFEEIPGAGHLIAEEHPQPVIDILVNYFSSN